jgi:outer membrane PBP1 activator LpoA protein
MNGKRICAGCIIILAGVLIAACFSFSSGNANMPASQDPNEMIKKYMQKMAQLDRQITSAATQTITPSLEKKEAVDYVLTPALLMQEAMSDDIVVTYPTE